MGQCSPRSGGFTDSLPRLRSTVKWLVKHDCTCVCNYVYECLVCRLICVYVTQNQASTHVTMNTHTHIDLFSACGAMEAVCDGGGNGGGGYSGAECVARCGPPGADSGGVPTGGSQEYCGGHQD